MKFVDLEYQNHLDLFQSQLSEAFESIKKTDLSEALFSFSDPERDFVEKIKAAYNSKNIGVFIGRNPNNKSSFTYVEYLRLDKYLKKLLTMHITNPIIKLLIKIVLVFIAVSILVGLVLAFGYLSAAFGTTAWGFLVEGNILGFGSFAVLTGSSMYATSATQDKLKDFLDKIYQKIGTNFYEYVNKNMGGTKFLAVINKITKLFTAKNDTEKNDVEQELVKI